MSESKVDSDWDIVVLMEKYFKKKPHYISMHGKVNKKSRLPFPCDRIVVCPSIMIEFLYILREVGSIPYKMSFWGHGALQWVWTKHGTNFVPHEYDGDMHEVDTKLGGGFELIPISFEKLLWFLCKV